MVKGDHNSSEYNQETNIKDVIPLDGVCISETVLCTRKFTTFFNSYSAKGNIELFAKNTDSGESAHNELFHLKSVLFSSEL